MNGAHVGTRRGIWEGWEGGKEGLGRLGGVAMGGREPWESVACLLPRCFALASEGKRVFESVRACQCQGAHTHTDTDTDADGRSASHIRCWQMPNRPGERGISVQTLTCVRDLPYVISTQ